MTWLKAMVDYEFARLRRKKSFYILVLLTLLPIVMVGVAKAMGAGIEYQDDLWAFLLGAKVNIYAGVLITPLSFLWIIGVLFGGDLLASEVEDGSIGLLASKPVSRLQIVVGKVVALLALFVIYYAASTAFSIVAAKAAGGGLDNLEYAPLILLVAVASTLGFAMLAACIGAYLGKTMPAILLSIAVYISTGILISVASFISVKDPEAMVNYIAKASMLVPLTSLESWTYFTYARLTGSATLFADIGAELLDKYYPYTTLESLATVAVLLLAAYKAYSSKDF